MFCQGILYVYTFLDTNFILILVNLSHSCTLIHSKDEFLFVYNWLPKLHKDFKYVYIALPTQPYTPTTIRAFVNSPYRWPAEDSAVFS